MIHNYFLFSYLNVIGTVPLFIDMGIVHFYNCFSEKLKKNRFWKLKENSMS